MKKTLLLLALTFSSFIFAQVPQGISYQAIALNSSGTAVVSSNVGLRLSLLDNSASGTVIYTETHSKTTTAQGLFNLVIGQGTSTFGIFSTTNWGINTKFLKVEMDIAGGTNYVLVGTTQLLSVPFALTSRTIVTGAGQGITLTSPNGTPYQVSVNDSGQLSLPSSGSNSTIPSTLYMYGSFNNFDPTTSLLFSNYVSYPGTQSAFNNAGYKYLTANTQLKFLAQNNNSSIIYGLNGSLIMIPNGSVYTVASNGFYFVDLERYTTDFNFKILSFSPNLIKFYNNIGTNINPTFNSVTNTFSFILNGLTTANFSNLKFFIPRNNGSTDSSNYGNVGDNLSDGFIDFDGSPILIPNLTTVPKNFRVDLILNFNGSGSYTITQIP